MNSISGKACDSHSGVPISNPGRGPLSLKIFTLEFFDISGSAGKVH
jgi:hypothetical protein